MLLRFLLWRFGRQLAAASQYNPRMQQQLTDRWLVFQLQTADGRSARHFSVTAGRLLTHAGHHPRPDIRLVFHNPHTLRRCLDPQQRQLVLLTGVQNGDIEFRGNPALSLWLQSLLDAADQRPMLAAANSACNPVSRSQQLH